MASSANERQHHRVSKTVQRAGPHAGGAPYMRICPCSRSAMAPGGEEAGRSGARQGRLAVTEPATSC